MGANSRCSSTVQASLSGAVGQVDTETADSLRRTSSSAGSHSVSDPGHSISSEQPRTAPTIAHATESDASGLVEAADESQAFQDRTSTHTQASTSYNSHDWHVPQTVGRLESGHSDCQICGSAQHRPTMQIPFSANACALSSQVTPLTGSLNSTGIHSSSATSHTPYATTSGITGGPAAYAAFSSYSGSTTTFANSPASCCHMPRGSRAFGSSPASCSHVLRGSRALGSSQGTQRCRSKRAVRRSPASRGFKLHAVQGNASTESAVTDATEGSRAGSSNRSPLSDTRDRYALLADQLAVTSSISEDEEDLFPDSATASSSDTSIDIPQGNGSSLLSSNAVNESTISLDLADLPTPPVQLPKPLRSFDATASSGDNAATPSVSSPTRKQSQSSSAPLRSGDRFPPPKSAALRSGDRSRSQKTSPDPQGTRRPHSKRAAARQSGDAAVSGTLYTSGVFYLLS